MSEGAVTPTPAPAPISPAGSSAGWSWTVWLAKNKTGLKWLATALFTFLSALVPGIESVELRGFLAALVAFASKLSLDWIDFRFSDVPLDGVKEPRT